MLGLDLKDCLKLTAAGFTGVFAGSAFYINAADHQARMTLDTVNARKHWAAAFHRAKKLQGIMAFLAADAAAGVYYLDKDSNTRWLWLLGGGVLITVWPWTMAVMLPDINKNLKPDALESQGETWVREHICRWNRQHAVRTIISMVAFDIFLYALLKG